MTTLTQTFPHLILCKSKAVNGPNVDYCPSNFAIRAEPGKSQRRVSWAKPGKTPLDPSNSAMTGVPYTRTNRMPDTEADFAMGDNLVEYEYGQQGVNPSVCAFLVSVLPGKSIWAVEYSTGGHGDVDEGYDDGQRRT